MKIESLITEAEYVDIILSLLESPYNISSLTKITFIAFCVKHEDNKLAYIKRTKDFVDTFIGNVSLKLTVRYEEIKMIFHVFKILENEKIIKIVNDSIEVIGQIPNHTYENEFLKFCNGKMPNPIIEVNKLDSKALLEEVIRYV